MSEENLSKLLSSIKNSDIMRLDIRCTTLDRFKDSSIVELCSMIQRSKLEYINFHGCNLDKLTDENFDKLFAAIGQSQIKALNLNHNRIDKFSDAKIQSLCASLRTSQLKELRLGFDNLNNIIENLSEQHFQALCNALSVSKISNLYLEGLEIEKLSEEKKKALSALMDNSNINLVMPMESKAELMLSKFSYLQQNPSQELISKYMKDLENFLEKFEEAIINDSKSDVEYIVRRAKRWQLLSDKISHQYINFLKNNSKFEEAVRFLLSIRPQSNVYENARMEAMQLVHLHNRDEGSLNAFIAALPCCLHEDSSFITLNTDDQRIFDGYLLAAANLKGLNLQLQPGYRLALLQYILLLEIKRSCQEAISSKGKTAFFTQNQHMAGLYDLLDKQLLSDASELEVSDKQKEIASLFSIVANRAMPLAEDQRSLLLAIQKLAAPIEAIPNPQQKSL